MLEQDFLFFPFRGGKGDGKEGRDEIKQTHQATGDRTNVRATFPSPNNVETELYTMCPTIPGEGLVSKLVVHLYSN